MSSAVYANYDVYLRLGRVSNLPTVWSNVLAGTVLAGGAAPGQVLLLAAACSLLYAGGMYLNDAFDRELDARERPERPIPSGRVSAARVFTLGFALLAAGVLAVAAASFGWEGAGGWPGVASAAVLAAVITGYDAWHKANPVAPAVMGLCRALVYITAALAVSGRAGAVVWGGAGVLLLYVAGLSYLARQENFAQVKNAWPLIALAAPFLYMLPAFPGNPMFVFLYLGFLGWVVYIVALLKRREPLKIRRAVVGLIAGISLLDALLLLIAGTGASGLAMLAALGFVLTLLLQRWAPGT